MSRQNTARQLIIDTYMQLLKEMPVSRITVVLMLQRAYISHSTFYYNFSSLDEVLDATMGYFCERIHDTMDFKTPSLIWSEDPDSYIRQHTLKVAERIYEEREVFSAIMHSKCKEAFQQRIISGLLEGYRPLAHLHDNEQVTRAEKRYFDYSMAYLTLGNYLAWYEGGFREPPEEFVDISFRMAQDSSMVVAPY